MKKVPIVVLVSGRGSNLRALLDFQRRRNCSYDIVRVVSDNSSAPALQLAEREGIASIDLPSENFSSKKDFFEALAETIEGSAPQYVVLAGFMRILPAWFIQRYPGVFLNIHPSLLPRFPGLHTHDRVLAEKEEFHGCTVHVVDEGVDTGPILAQARLAIQPLETVESLASRVLELEHYLLPRVLHSLCQGVPFLSCQSRLCA